METLEVHSKAFVIRWVEAPAGSTIQWKVTPLKKSINFGVFRYVGSQSPGSAMETGGANNVPMEKRLEQQGFENVTKLDKISGNDVSEGKHSVPYGHGGLFSFVFDNTFSISTAKTVTFSFSVAGEGQLTSASVPASEDTGPTTSSDGRHLTGALMKKRRKKLQGFAKRWFSLDMRLGLLNYYLDQKSSYLRGVMPIKICDITVNENSRDITLDSGVERWQLRAPTKSDFESWVTAFQAARSSTVGHILSRQGSYASGGIGTARVTPRKAESRKGAPANDWVSTAAHVSQLSAALDEFRSSGTADSDGPGKVFAERVQKFLIEAETLVGQHSEEVGQVPDDIEVDEDDEFYDAIDSFRGGDDDSEFSDISDDSDDEGGVRRMPSRRSTGTSFSDGPKQPRRSSSFQESDDEIGIRAGQTVTPSESHSAGSGSAIRAAVGAAAGVAAAGSLTLSGEDDKAQPRTPARSERPSLSKLSIAEEDEEPEAQPVGSKSTTETEGPAAVPVHTEPEKQAAPEPTIEKLYPLPHAPVKRRTEVPKSKHSPPSLISMIRKSAGKDLSSITAPVTSNEPITHLQKISELLEYTELLGKAASLSDAGERCLFVALFAITSLASVRSKERAIRKPFNPLLGETYELVREDKGFRYISEKVSHRPPVFATHTESEKWTIHFTSRPHQKIWGKSAEITDTGIIKITLLEHDETYEFLSADCFLRNLIAGEKYVEPVGTVTVDSSSGYVAVAEFKVGGMFSGRSEELKVFLQDDPSKQFEGKWTEGMWRSEGGKRGEQVWAVGDLVRDPKERYGWTTYTASLNEITALEKDKIPFNDSRQRQDMRVYEQQENIDKAEELKLAYEQKQRDRRKVYEDSNKVWEPVFFKSKPDAKGMFTPLSGRSNYWTRRATGDWEGITNVLEL